MTKLYRVSIEIDVTAQNPKNAKIAAIKKLKRLPIEEIDYKDADYESVTVELMEA
jgi:hypothetical protein